MLVDRCVCHQVTFRELKDLADQLATSKAVRTDFDTLSRRTRCGTSCELCRPYIEVMLATGRTELPVMSEDECKRTVAEAGGEV